MTATGARERGGAPAALFVWTTVAASLVTVAVVVGEIGAYRVPTLRVALETANTVVALLVAFLMYGRFARNARAQELLFVLGLSVNALANLVLTALPAVSASAELTRLAALPVRLAGSVLLAAAAITPRSVRLGRRAAAATAALVVGTVAVVGVLGVVWSHGLRTVVGVPAPWADGAALPFAAGWLVPVSQAVGAALFGIAALALLRQAGRTREDELLRWVAAGCVLGAFARVHYVMFPSLYTDYLYSGDLLRLGFFVYLLIGASREIEFYWRVQSRTAVIDERRRVARELHDGVIQEVTYIRAESAGLPADSPSRTRIVDACDRALDEARAAVQALGHEDDEPLATVLRRAADELAARYRIDVQADLDDSVRTRPEQGHGLMRITREAVANAVRHGRAGRVRLRLDRNGDDRRLTIADEGDGFDVAAVTSRDAGYGLVSMRERARALPGSLEIDSAPGTGSVVTVRW